VPATASYSPTGDPYIDGVLGGTKWAVTIVEFDHSMFADFDSVVAAGSQAGSNTVIILDADNTLTLTNVMVSTLHHDDFSFS
jgi:NADH:ubiquinone oxidoreductase subunit F (NADH-binding)